MPTCAAVYCSNTQFSGCGKTFHLFPFSQPNILKQWLGNMGREVWIPSKRAVLCSDHFEEKSFDRTGCTTRIRANAVPTLFTSSPKPKKGINVKEKALKSKTPRHSSKSECTKVKSDFQLGSEEALSTAGRPKRGIKRRCIDMDLGFEDPLHIKARQRETPKTAHLQNRGSPQKPKKSPLKLTYSRPSKLIAEEVLLPGSTVSTSDEDHSLVDQELDDDVDPLLIENECNSETFQKENEQCEASAAVETRNTLKKDKVTRLLNDFIHIEFATPKRQVVLKVNNGTDSSELTYNNLFDLTLSLKEKGLLTSEVEELINAFGVLPDGLTYRNTETSVTDISLYDYSEEVKKLATLLFINSLKTYDMVNKIFMLPDKSIVRSRFKVNGYWPGFTKEVLDLLKDQIFKNTGDKMCSIMFDSVSLKRRHDFDTNGDRWIGHVDFAGGQIPCSADENLLCTEVLMFIAVGLTSDWKLPFGYFLHKGLCGELLRNLLQEAILVLEESGLNVKAVVCDGSGTTVKMGKLFGCTIQAKTYTEIVTSFPHPLHPAQKLYIVYGIQKTVKLLKNLLAEKGSLQNSTYGKIDWKYLKLLIGKREKKKPGCVYLQQASHMEFYHLQRISRYCNSVFNCTVSKALKIALDLGLEAYNFSRGTSDFVADVHRALGLLNSRNPVSSEDKPPIRQITLLEQVESMKSVAERLLSLETSGGKCISKDQRWMSVVLFAFTLKSVSHLAAELVNERTCRYFNTYRVNFDHFDLVLSSLQRCGEWEDTPTPFQFRKAYRRLLAQLSTKTYDKCDFDGEDITVSQGKIYLYRNPDFFRDDYCLHFPAYTDLDTDVQNGAKCIVHQVSQRLSCSDCVDILVDDDHTSDCRTNKVFINLIKPSRFVIKLLKTTEKTLKLRLVESNLIKVEHLVLCAQFYFFTVNEKLVLSETGQHHFTEEPYHIICLIKVIIRSYLFARLRESAKKMKEFHRVKDLVM